MAKTFLDFEAKLEYNCLVKEGYYHTPNMENPRSTFPTTDIPVEKLPDTLSLKVGESGEIDGVFASIKIAASKINPGKTAWHEAKHIVPAYIRGTGIEGASIESDSTSLGRTYLSEFDPVAALAPDADGCDGTSWDVHIAESMGENNFANRFIGSRILSSHKRLVRGVAEFLEQEKTVKKEKLYGRFAELKKGEEHILSFETKDGHSGEISFRTENPYVTIIKTPKNDLALAA